MKLTDTRTFYLDVHGMSCKMCAGRIERTLNRMTGVRASVDFPAKVAVIQAGHDRKAAEFCEAIREAGYDAQVRVDGTDHLLDAPLPSKPALLERVTSVAEGIFRRLSPN
ncbi:heavy metal-associated domain-containing protein [Mycolicibacterium sp. Y3]